MTTRIVREIVWDSEVILLTEGDTFQVMYYVVIVPQIMILIVIILCFIIIIIHI